MHAHGIVPCIISFSRQLPCFLMVWPWYASFLALIVPSLLQLYWGPTHLFFSLSTKLAVSLQSFRLKGVKTSFSSVQLSQPYIASSHTSAFISRIFVEISMLCFCQIFCSDSPIACFLFNVVQNSVVHLFFFCNHENTKVKQGGSFHDGFVLLVKYMMYFSHSPSCNACDSRLYKLHTSIIALCSVTYEHLKHFAGSYNIPDITNDFNSEKTRQEMF